MTSIAEAEKKAEKEKNLVALSSVLAAIFITCFKLVIGLLTHSLGILAEAAHSGLDLAAAAVTFFAVRISGRPADEKQEFGYGKVENLSALFETLLLLLTCIWIIYEAIQRLFFHSVQVEVSIWSFVVMLTSITVDLSRSRALMRAAKKHGSQALEADALHFSTDVWSSTVVIAGLILVAAGEFLRNRALVPAEVTAWLYRADAIAALGVSIIVIFVSVNLGKRTIEGLLDRAPHGLRGKIIEEVSRIPGLLKVRQVRIRPSGPYNFVDMILEIPRNASFEQAHEIGVQAKAAVKGLVERSDVIIHMDPMVQNRESVIESVRSVAARNGLGVHSIRVHDRGQGISLEMHVEVPEGLSVGQAHERASAVEAQVRHEIDDLIDVVTHIEPVGDSESRRPASQADSEKIRQAIFLLPCEEDGLTDCHEIAIYQEDEGISISFHCSVPPTTSINDAHRLTARLERQLRARFPELDRVYIHVEPPEKSDREAA